LVGERLLERVAREAALPVKCRTADNPAVSASTGERRVVSVLLADIAGSTAIGEQLGPERSKFLFDEVVRLIAGEVKRYGGTVAQFTGDGLYALFGVPTAHEDDAERAVRAALSIHQVLAGYGRDVAEAYGIDLAARVGVNTGPVVLLSKEAPPEERYNALGDTVNVAARLQSHAGSSGVAIGPGTARQVEPSFELEPLGPLALKGKAEPMEAFRVSGERERVQQRASPLVGRDRELELLDEVVGGLAEGKGAIVAITGEPGIGKSRLVAEARDRRGDQVRFLAAQGVSYAQEVPYYPLRELLRGFLELGMADPEARVRLELKARLATALGERSDVYYPFLAPLIGLALEEDTADRLIGLARDSIQRQTHEAVVELCRAVSRERPLCLVLEDLHFADEPTLELCRELLSLADEEAVAILLLYRPDPDLPSWELGEAARRLFRHRFRELDLEPLDQTDGALLAASAAGGDLPTGLAAELVERTGGNPLFLEEAARDLVERGDGAAVPAAIQETLQARLDRLAPEAREVAAVASVVGRTFGTTLLERIVAPDRLRPALSDLQRLDLVVEERRRPTPEYRFRHGLVQEAAYRNLLEDRRRELHRVVGAALEELHEEELSEAYGLLARHFAEADEPEKAAKYLLEAGDAARSVNADDEAIALYRRALSFLDQLDDAGRARTVLFKIAVAQHLAFDFEAANAAWAEAFARREPLPERLEPTERIETLLRPTPGDFVPGYTYDIPGWTFAPNLYRGLLRLEEGLDVAPDLAEHVAVSADGRVYRFRLRQGLRWSDGEPLTAADFAFTYGAMIERSVRTAHLLAGIECAALDERAVELRVAEPQPYVPYLLAQAPLFPWPRHRVELLGDSWRRPDAFVGNGPFVVAEIDDEELLFAANPFWAGPRGNVREVAMGFQVDERLGDWRSGHFDFLFTGHRLELGDAPDTIERRLPLLGVGYLGFNRARPPLDDERVRRALAHGLDRAALLPAGHESTYGGFLPPAMPGHSHDLALPFDLERARGLLADAGYRGGKGLPEILLTHADFGFGDDYRRKVEARWRSPWEELGVRISHEWMASDVLFSPAGKLSHMWEWGWGADYPDPEGMLGSFLETASLWLGDPELNVLIARARSLHSRDERLRLYREVDRRLVSEQVELVPMYYDEWFLVHRPWLHGLWATPTQLGSLERLVVRH
jgi:ABC-type transport system substrate-binding protein/class 3 adenylate cyclase